MSSVPPEILTKLSQRACEIARGKAPRKTGKGASLLKPMEGKLGITIPAEVYYMFFQEVGISPFVMYGLVQNKDPNTIPIRGPNGELTFRKASSKTIGKHRITSRDAKGRIITSDIRWRHPGMKPKNFIHESLEQSVREWWGQMDERQLKEMLFKMPEYSKAVKMLYGEDKKQ